jgi:hypothetical protein
MPRHVVIVGHEVFLRGIEDRFFIFISLLWLKNERSVTRYLGVQQKMHSMKVKWLSWMNATKIMICKFQFEWNNFHQTSKVLMKMEPFSWNFESFNKCNKKFRQFESFTASAVEWMT